RHTGRRNTYQYILDRRSRLDKRAVRPQRNRPGVSHGAAEIAKIRAVSVTIAISGLGSGFRQIYHPVTGDRNRRCTFGIDLNASAGPAANSDRVAAIFLE